MSLKAALNQMIYNRRGDIVSVNEIYEYCAKARYKQSNAERCLRPSLSPNVEAVKKNGYIIGYKWVDKPQKEIIIEPDKTPEKNPEQPNTRNIGTEGQGVPEVRQAPLPSEPHLPQRLI